MGGPDRPRHGLDRITGPDSNRPGSHHPGRGLFPLSIRSSLVVVVLIPLAMAVGLASTVVLGQWSTRHHALMAQRSSLVLDSLLQDRVAVYDEYVPTAAILAGRVNHLSPTTLDGLLGVEIFRQIWSPPGGPSTIWPPSSPEGPLPPTGRD